MNSNLFERKTYLDGNWMSTNISEYFSTSNSGQNTIIKVNLLRATANESDLLKNHFKNVSVNNTKTVIVDLSECNFVDSTFLSSIISYNKTINAEVKLIVADKRQLTIFKITKLDSLFRIYLSLDQAIA